MKTWYLIKTTNQLLEYRKLSTQMKAQNVGQVLDDACGSLKLLVDDLRFFDALQELADRQWEAEIEARHLLGDVALFTTGFMFVEKTAMKQAGLTEYAANALLTEVYAFRTSMNDIVIDPESVYAQAQKLQEICCKLAEEAKGWDLQRDQQVKRRHQISMLQRGLAG